MGKNEAIFTDQIEYIKRHAAPIKGYGKSKEINYPCPVCNDRKPNNFYFNTEKGTGYCQKCGTAYSAYEYAKLLGYKNNESENPAYYKKYYYTDRKGNFIYGKHRYDFQDGNKAYVPVIRVNKQLKEVKKKDALFETYSDIFENLPRVVYNLPRVSKSEIVFFVEGEKCSDRLQEEINKQAEKKNKHLEKWASTTIYETTKSEWNIDYSEQLSGKIVIIIPDNDEPGRKFSIRAYSALKKSSRVSIVNIPGLGEKEDIFDFFESGKGWDDFYNIVIKEIPELGLNDIDRSKDFCNQYSDLVRHSNISGYLVWSGRNWEPNENKVIEMIKAFSMQKYDSLMKKYEEDKERNKEFKKMASKVSSERAVRSILNLSKSDSSIAIKESSLDENKNLLNLKNATYDLMSHRIYKHSQDDNLTILLSYNYEQSAKCPTWETFLDRVFKSDSSLISYIQKMIGYTLTGETKLQNWFFMYGSGRNGKSVFAETLSKLLGDYGTKIRTESIMSKDYVSGGDTPNPEVAKLRGKRFVLASEVSDGHKLNEALVKDITGGDTISARFLNQNSFEFSPQCKLWMYGNHKPVVKGTDDGIWRRIKLIPFNVTIPENEVDPLLIDKLTNELPGILNWAIDGLKQLQKDSYLIDEPEIIKKETKSYREEMDIIGLFLKDCDFTFDSSLKYPCKDVYQSYTEYCKENGFYVLSHRRVSDYLKSKGVVSEAGTGNQKSYKGLGKN